MGFWDDLKDSFTAIVSPPLGLYRAFEEERDKEEKKKKKKREEKAEEEEEINDTYSGIGAAYDDPGFEPKEEDTTKEEWFKEKGYDIHDPPRGRRYSLEEGQAICILPTIVGGLILCALCLASYL